PDTQRACGSGLSFGASAVRPHQPTDCPELATGCSPRMRLDGAIEAHKLLAGWRDDGTTAATPADLSRDGRVTQRIIYLLDQQPRAAVRHVQHSCSGGDRSGRANGFQKCDFSGTDAIAIFQIDAD